MNSSQKPVKQKIAWRHFVMTATMLFTLTMNTFATVSGVGEFRMPVGKELSFAKTPCASVAVISGNEVEYISYQDGNSESSIDESALFQIGSVSKQFTGLGILLLEDQGALSLDAPVVAYLPWFSVLYDGKTVSPDAFTVADCLYQTSGFTNDENRYPAAEGAMSLEDGVRIINGSELAFQPGERFSYANANYRILGLIIEAVSGQSYNAFMEEQILSPLGMEHTYASQAKAQSKGQVVEGSKLSFLKAWPYAVSVSDGNVPAGYLYSNAKDMSRWLQIQLGEVEASGQLQRIIDKSHQPNSQSVVDDTTQYAAGWYVNTATGAIYHSGGTPNYSAYVEIRPASGSAVCVLTNMNASANTNHVGANIFAILEGKPAEPHATDIWSIMDFIFTLVTGGCVLGVMGYIFFFLRQIPRIRSNKLIKKKLTAKNIKAFILPTFIALLAIAVAVVMPVVFGNSWPSIGFWGPVSLPAGFIALSALSVCAYLCSFLVVRYKEK